ncbi:DUF4352 domain-containing protein [Paenilisteria rocourtiae]|uniref:Uncharacterized protein DUF4352 n=1 Tax=Listeria rocourtiae TaxID=647910 RepID=A0A4R6ZNG8_9LIST|nr:DUF4352 domain-containing protein [Listeria rocourtiae]EUJ51579.1 hypothetical protein PROCOU_01789 [Listeria rocourtiae FSL F6-920]TDR53669.1 uncharacterized protein DUF4352 [Listeria rocourtiae]
MMIALILFSVFFLFLCLIALIVGIILLIVRRNKMLGAIMTSSSAFLGIIFCGVLVSSMILSSGFPGMSMMRDHPMMYDDLMDGSTYDDTGGEDDPYNDYDEYYDEDEDYEYFSDDYTQYKVGQAAEVEDNVFINITKMEKWAGDKEFNSPMAGYYVKATVTIENKASRSTTYYADDFLIYDNDGLEGDNAYKEDWRVVVKPNTKVTKEIYFDVYGDGPFHIACYDASWSGNIK